MNFICFFFLLNNCQNKSQEILYLLLNKKSISRSDAIKIIVLFTDGLSIDDPLKPAHELRDIKRVKIYVVSVGSDGFEPEMNRIAGDKRNVFG